MQNDTTKPSQPVDPPGAPSRKVVTRSYGVVILAIAIAVFFALNDKLFAISMSVKADDFQWFALLYVMAQAIERILEPIMSRVKGKEVADAKAAVAGARTGAAGSTVAAAAQTELAGVQADRAVIAWAIASSLALLICGALGLGVFGDLANITAAPGFSTDFFDAADVVVTGLVIGAGTKPLHDLITRIEKAKTNADPETQPA